MPNSAALTLLYLFSGLLPWLAKRLLARETQRGFDAMNHALEARAEQRR